MTSVSHRSCANALRMDGGALKTVSHPNSESSLPSLRKEKKPWRNILLR